jgi:pyruvate ferredoxin oxidoreductase delta subunit
MPIAVVVPAVPKGGRNPGYKTASSRTYKPEINYDQCVRCRTCWIFCPDGAIDMNEEGYPSLNYDYCTGCNICKNNCPVDAYEVKLELEMEA